VTMRTHHYRGIGAGVNGRYESRLNREQRQRGKRRSRGMLPRHSSPALCPRSRNFTMGTAVFDRIGRHSHRPRPDAKPIARSIVQKIEAGTQMDQTVDAEAAQQVIDVEVVEERNADAYGFTVKVLANGLLHRILPVRDPHQPRFWCVVVFRCSPGGIPDASEQPWVGLGGLRREELKETMSAIRANPSSWLAETAHGQLRDWMLAPGPVPIPAARRSVTAPATSHPAAE
jgi:hypothetical protein